MIGNIRECSRRLRRREQLIGAESYGQALRGSAQLADIRNLSQNVKNPVLFDTKGLFETG